MSMQMSMTVKRGVVFFCTLCVSAFLSTAWAQAKRTYTGSGFLVGATHVITNNHVVEECDQVWAIAGARRTKARRQFHLTAPDLALLVLDAPLPDALPAAVRPFAHLGEDVLVAGYPLSGLLSSDLVVTRGIVNALTGIRDEPGIMQISAEVQPGSSGGPVLDRTGAVVGVVVSKLDAAKALRLTGDIPQNVNFAIKPEALNHFLGAAEVRAAKASAEDRRLDGTELAARARKFTVGIECTADAFTPLRWSIRTAESGVVPPVPQFSTTEQRLEYLRWLEASSAKLKTLAPGTLDHREFLQTLWYESRRAGLYPSLTLSVAQQLSGFRRFHVSSNGARGYMAVLPHWSSVLGEGTPEALFTPQVNFRYGCVLLRHFIDQNQGDLRAALAAYLTEVSMTASSRSPQVNAMTRRIIDGMTKWEAR